MKFIKFNDSKIDSLLFMELTDLAKTLAKSDQVEVEYGVQSYYNPFEKKIYMSHFWKDRNHRDMVDGLKSDVYLRSIGSRYSSMKDFSRMLDSARKYQFKSLAKQLFMLLRISELKSPSRGSAPVQSRYFQTGNRCTANTLRHS